jgi:hypothetical protein
MTFCPELLIKQLDQPNRLCNDLNYRPPLSPGKRIIKEVDQVHQIEQYKKDEPLTLKVSIEHRPSSINPFKPATIDHHVEPRIKDLLHPKTSGPMQAQVSRLPQNHGSYTDLSS